MVTGAPAASNAAARAALCRRSLSNCYVNNSNAVSARGGWKMDHITEMPTELRQELQEALLALARREEQAALAEEAQVAYWQHPPASVARHRSGAALLREAAQELASPAPVGL
jgi:hypothetical protein